MYIHTCYTEPTYAVPLPATTYHTRSDTRNELQKYDFFATAHPQEPLLGSIGILRRRRSYFRLCRSSNPVGLRKEASAKRGSLDDVNYRLQETPFPPTGRSKAYPPVFAMI